MNSWLTYVLVSRYGMELGRPTFIPVQDLEMGFEKIVKVAHARGGRLYFVSNYAESLNHIYPRHFIAVCKRQDAIAKLRAEVC